MRRVGRGHPRQAELRSYLGWRTQRWPGDLRGGHDDSHNYHDFAPWLSNPGRGWVMVQADEQVLRLDWCDARAAGVLRREHRA